MRLMRCAAPAALLLVAAPVAAQSIWVSPLTSRGELGVEWTRPSFEDNTGLGNFRGVWIASGRYRVGEHGAIVGAIPRFVGGGFESTGNLYVGYQSWERDGGSIFNVGLRLPTASENGNVEQFVALAGDFDRYEQMAPKMLILHAEGQGKVWRDSAGAEVQVRAGFTLMHPTAGSPASENSFLFDYGVRFGHRWPRLELGAALTGRMIMTGGGGGNFLQRNVDQATAELIWHGRVTPHVGFRLPIDEQAKDLLKSAIIVGIELPLP